MMGPPTDPADDDDVLARADALLGRHRNAVPPAPAATPLFIEVGGAGAADIPTLTDIVVAPGAVPVAPPPEGFKAPAVSVPAAKPARTRRAS